MARTPKPLRRWKRKAFRALAGDLKQRFTRSGARIRIGGEAGFNLRPRSLRLYR